MKFVWKKDYVVARKVQRVRDIAVEIPEIPLDVASLHKTKGLEESEGFIEKEGKRAYLCTG